MCITYDDRAWRDVKPVLLWNFVTSPRIRLGSEEDKESEMPARNTFAATRRSHAILKRMRQGEGVTIRQVSKEFGIQYPQARADLKLLEELYDLNTYRDGRIKVWEMSGVRDKATQVGIVAALELGGVALDVFKHTPYGERIDELTEDWRRQVPDAQRERMERLSKGLVLRRNWLPTDSRRMLEALEEFLDAIALKRAVEMRYERADGQEDDYIVVPRRLIWYQGRLWLQAVDEGDQKLFDVAGVLKTKWMSREAFVERRVEQRLAQMSPGQEEQVDSTETADEEGAQPQEEPTQRELLTQEVSAEVEGWFELQSREKEDEYFEDAFGIYADNFEVSTVELKVQNSWANYLRRYRLHPSQENEEGEDGLRVRFEIGICPEFKSFILGMVPDVEVLSPDHLREELVERTKRWKG